MTLEEESVVMFPDAPTERGIKHINTLCSCVEQGYGGCIAFVIQMTGVKRCVYETVLKLSVKIQ